MTSNAFKELQSMTVDTQFREGDITVRPEARLHEPLGMSPSELLDEFYYKMAAARRCRYKARIAELESRRNEKGPIRVSRVISWREVS